MDLRLKKNDTCVYARMNYILIEQADMIRAGQSMEEYPMKRSLIKSNKF